MGLSGKMLIGGKAVRGTGDIICAVNPATDETLEPGYPGGNSDHVSQACAAAWAAFDTYRETSTDKRATFLESIAEEIESLGETLVDRAVAESGLPRGRIQGEVGRTCFQLRTFARTVRAGGWLDIRVDEARPDRQPLPRPDIRLRQIALGPVAVFGASNFPLAFSVAGGDTASALAAGCPVVVKAHSAHPGTSELVGQAIRRAVVAHELPDGVFSLLYGSGFHVGISLVTDPRIKAVGFTGSRSGGTALAKAAQQRPEPIPVYAEMSSINPVFLFGHGLATRSAEMAQGFVDSLNMGAGQFCTSPGLVIACKGNALDDFIRAAQEAVSRSAPQTMLTPGIFKAYQQGVERLKSVEGSNLVGAGLMSDGPNQCQPQLFVTTAREFMNQHALKAEVFGSTSLIVQCQDEQEMLALAEELEGQLTATIHMADDDTDTVRRFVPTLERKAGRVLINGWPTGVEVCDAMVHGGPYPATSDARTTSVGTAAIQRFLRPVSYQNFSDTLLQPAIQRSNPLNLPRLVNGNRSI